MCTLHSEHYIQPYYAEYHLKKKSKTKWNKIKINIEKPDQKKKNKQKMTKSVKCENSFDNSMD
jgi:hypothetical protein